MDEALLPYGWFQLLFSAFLFVFDEHWGNFLARKPEKLGFLERFCRTAIH